jgi:formamidopyrimidine-DNA glycosylase
VPELPEVDAIAGVANKYAAGNAISVIQIDRWNGKYFTGPEGPTIGPHLTAAGWPVIGVYRVGKQVAIALDLPAKPFILVHNAMTGYFDWEHEPWTFDYVEGDREAGAGDVRVRFMLKDGRVLRFHDARLFGSMRMASEREISEMPPELMKTPNLMPNRPIMTLEEFYAGLQESRSPIKVRLMDQMFLGGIGNIYSVEALHAAGIHPQVRSNQLLPEEASALHASLRWSVDHSIPQVKYDWLNVYRRTTCGTCGSGVSKVKLGGRSTFFCPKCQVP